MNLGSNEIEVLKIQDSRGTLLSLDLSLLPFIVKRIFSINVQSTEYSRGGHAHHECWQGLLPMDSQVTCSLEFANNSVVQVIEPGNCLVIPPRIWLSVKFHKANSSILVLASHKHDESDYIRSKDQFASMYESL